MKPLDGVRVVELGGFIAGPYAGMLLGELGADVIKVESPGQGDPFRGWGDDGYSAHFQAYNRNKRSLTLNLRTDKGREIFYRLIASVDVVIENFRPGVPERLGVDYPTLSARNHRLIYCSISGFGQQGPYRDRPSYDTVAQALSGLSSLYLDPTRPRLVGPALSDGLAGLFACYGVLGALVARHRTGRGCLVETSMLESAVAFLTEAFQRYFVTGEVPGPHTRPRSAQAYVLVARDGQPIALHLSSPPKFWEALVRALGRAELAEDPRFRDWDSRVKHYEELEAILEEAFKDRPRDEWLKILVECDVPCAPVLRIDEVLRDPQVSFLGLVVEMSHASKGTTRGLRSPVRFNGSTACAAQAPPELGEQTEEILRELGYDAEQVMALRAEGIV